MKAMVLAMAAAAAIGLVTGCTDDGNNSASGTASSSAGPDESLSRSPITSPGSAGPSSATTPPSRDDATVDARDYQQGNHFYFQSPSGNIMCGFINETSLGTGCQVEKATVVPAELPECGTRPERAVTTDS